MTIKTLAMGPNSCCIYNEGGGVFQKSELGLVYDAIQDWLVLHGWELYDTTGRGTFSEESNIANYDVYRAPMADDDTVYKYVKICRAISHGYSRSFEEWNNSTHVGVNPSNSTPTAKNELFGAPSNPELISATRIYLFATARYLDMFVANTNYIGHNGFYLHELTKDIDAEVTGEYPRWVFGNIQQMFLDRAAEPYENNRHAYMAVCRQIPYPGVTTNYNRMNLSYGLWGVTTGSTVIPDKNNPLEPNKVQCFNLHAVYPPCVYSRGKLMGMTLLQSGVGRDLDTIQIPMDDNLVYNKDGELTDHYVIVCYYNNYYATGSTEPHKDYGRIALPK